jgi:hypothetical protein
VPLALAQDDPYWYLQLDHDDPSGEAARPASPSLFALDGAAAPDARRVVRFDSFSKVRRRGSRARSRGGSIPTIYRGFGIRGLSIILVIGGGGRRKFIVSPRRSADVRRASEPVAVACALCSSSFSQPAV